ncbi:N,N-dimethylformamidase beta subunit family domain-containing protein, partial [Asanoa sp. NPDC050611]|uniref:N,N-dimethylformamidase beta subunit family domain-containing protein n=1 Tax=Asanoa sp. NPDC050611 TaxID=3157098 RepID=UPI0033D2FCE2
DRPIRDSGLPHLVEHDIGFVQWAEKHGDDVSYATSEDLDNGRVDPGHYRAVIFCGHDEYWTVAMRRAVVAARNGGTSVVFLSANNCYWRVRYGVSAKRPDDRVISCTKDRPRPGKPVPLMTQWRMAGSPEQELIGAQYVSVVDGRAPLVVRDSAHWFWAGTGSQDGDEIPDVVWGEADQVVPDVPLPEATQSAILASSPYHRKGEVRQHHTTLYQAPSGAWVFAAGSLGWSATLHATQLRSPRIQQATRNLLNHVLAKRADPPSPAAP